MKIIPVAEGKTLTQTKLVGNTYSILQSWRSGKVALPNFPSLANKPISNSSFSLRIEKCIPVYEAAKLPDQHFDIAWQVARDYADRCRDCLGLPDYRQLSQEQVDQLDQCIPENPPVACYPIYFMTVCEPMCSTELVAEGQRIEHRNYYMTLPCAESNERVVYVGRTFAEHRFKNGHHSITKLLQSQYEGLEKWLYLARLVYRQENGIELPLEWIHEKDVATQLLVSAEGQLIFSLDPELNEKNEPIIHPKDFTICNLVNQTSVLRDVIGFVSIDPND